MKKLLGILLSIALLLSCVAYADETAAPALEKDVYVLFTSDVHCGIDQGFGYVGLAAVKNYLAKSSHVILVDNGDAIQGEPVGTMTNGSAVVDLMNAVGYELATIGNHEFDYGMENFLALAEKANYEYICCNFTHEGETVFAPYAIKEFDGLKVAFIGIATPRTFTSSTPVYFQDAEGNFVYGFCEKDNGQELYAAVQSAIDAARAEGADIVIGMSHLGIEEECQPWTSNDVIANTTGMDVLLDGHSHSVLEQDEMLNKDGDTVLRAACGTKLANIGYLKIAVDGTLSTGLYQWTLPVAAPEFLGIENEMTAPMVEATSALDEALSQIIAQSQVDLIIADPETGARVIRNTETNLGDLCADAYRYVTGADVAFINGGGIRVAINAGDITMENVYKVHPFGNACCMVKASGQQILDALEWTTRNVPGENGGFLHASGLTYEIHTYLDSTVTYDDKTMFTGVAGEYRVKNVMINGEPLDPEKIYTVAGTNYTLKNSGDGTTSFADCEVVLDEIMLDNQVLITYVTEALGGVIGEEYADIWGQGRITVVTEKP